MGREVIFGSFYPTLGQSWAGRLESAVSPVTSASAFHCCPGLGALALYLFSGLEKTGKLSGSFLFKRSQNSGFEPWMALKNAKVWVLP